MIARAHIRLSLAFVLLGLQPVAPGPSRTLQGTAAAADQAPSMYVVPEVRILAPHEGAFVTGLTRLSAGVEPPEAVSGVVFFANGREVCSAPRPPFECEWDAGLLVAEHQIRVVANLAGGGRVVRTARTRGTAFAETVAVDIVQVTVTVIGEDGHFVKGLPRAAFRVSEDGRPQEVSHFYADNVPLDLLVAVDASGSMRPALPTVRGAVAAFLGAVPPRHRVTLVAFNDTIFPLTRHQTDPAERVKAVNRLSSWGSTVLYDAMLEGIRLLGAQPGRKALVVFTDGEDQGSFASLSDVQQGLQSNDLTLYMIGQGRGVTNERLKQLMERLARPTGGRALFAERADRLTESFAELLDELSNQYVLGYHPTNDARDGTWRRIAVQVDGRHRVRARQGYRAR
jgi:VWFA-related protein